MHGRAIILSACALKDMPITDGTVNHVPFAAYAASPFGCVYLNRLNNTSAHP